MVTDNDVVFQESTGIVSAPMRSFICKVASRCDINCDYCYVYHHPDQSWRAQPARLTEETAIELGRRIAEHASSHSIDAVDVVMHGGEPLIAGLPHLRVLCNAIIESAAPVHIRFRMQTNGVRFDKAALDFCIEFNVLVGLSCDGPKECNDRHRVDHFGKSTFRQVQRAIDLLSGREGRNIWSGFLTVIDIQNNPIDVYQFLRSFDPASIEFLLPLANNDRLPPPSDISQTPYADWLLHVFNLWYHERPQRTSIRRFRDIIGLMAGAQSSSEEWGLQPVDFAVIETNGDLQIVDTLKTAFDGANHLGLNLNSNSFDEMLRHPAVRERQVGEMLLCNTCRNCKLVHVCGGGYYPHRYSDQNGFNNPSVYCRDLQKLIRGIHATVSEDLMTITKIGQSESEPHNEDST